MHKARLGNAVQMSTSFGKKNIVTHILDHVFVVWNYFIAFLEYAVIISDLETNFFFKNELSFSLTPTLRRYIKLANGKKSSEK